MLSVKWRSDGRGGVVYEDDELVGFIGLEDWYEPGARDPRVAWVVQFMVPGVGPMQRALLELDGEPATDKTRAAELGTKAKAVVEQGAPATPSPFGHAPTGGSNAEIRELIQLTGHALDSAAGRVMAAAQDERPHAVMVLNVAVTEMMGWLRTIDELGALIWSEKLTTADREAASQDADRFISSPEAAAGLVSNEYAARQADGRPYADWTVALLGAHIGGWVPREQLRASDGSRGRCSITGRSLRWSSYSGAQARRRDGSGGSQMTSSRRLVTRNDLVSGRTMTLRLPGRTCLVSSSSRNSDSVSSDSFSTSFHREAAGPFLRFSP